MSEVLPLFVMRHGEPDYRAYGHLPDEKMALIPESPSRIGEMVDRTIMPYFYGLKIPYGKDLVHKTRATTALRLEKHTQIQASGIKKELCEDRITEEYFAQKMAEIEAEVDKNHAAKLADLNGELKIGVLASQVVRTAHTAEAVQAALTRHRVFSALTSSLVTFSRQLHLDSMPAKSFDETLSRILHTEPELDSEQVLGLDGLVLVTHSGNMIDLGIQAHAPWMSDRNPFFQDVRLIEVPREDIRAALA